MRLSAAGTPMSLGSRWVPPAPGSRPRVTSGSPSMAWEDRQRCWAWWIEGAAGQRVDTQEPFLLHELIRGLGTHPESSSIIVNRLVDWLWSERCDNDSPEPVPGRHQKRPPRWPPPRACWRTRCRWSSGWGAAPRSLYQTPWCPPLLEQGQRQKTLSPASCSKWIIVVLWNTPVTV